MSAQKQKKKTNHPKITLDLSPPHHQPTPTTYGQQRIPQPIIRLIAGRFNKPSIISINQSPGAHLHPQTQQTQQCTPQTTSRLHNGSRSIVFRWIRRRLRWIWQSLYQSVLFEHSIAGVPTHRHIAVELPLNWCFVSFGCWPDEVCTFRVVPDKFQHLFLLSLTQASYTNSSLDQ